MTGIRANAALTHPGMGPSSDKFSSGLLSWRRRRSARVAGGLTSNSHMNDAQA